MYFDKYGFLFLFSLYSQMESYKNAEEKFIPTVNIYFWKGKKKPTKIYMGLFSTTQ